MTGPYKAVDVYELRDVLGTKCSPGFGRTGFVIGPDVNGRICHVASCFYLHEAKALAARYNEEHASKEKERRP